MNDCPKICCIWWKKLRIMVLVLALSIERIGIWIHHGTRWKGISFKSWLHILTFLFFYRIFNLRTCLNIRGWFNLLLYLVISVSAYIDVFFILVISLIYKLTQDILHLLIIFIPIQIGHNQIHQINIVTIRYLPINLYRSIFPFY